MLPGGNLQGYIERAVACNACDDEDRGEDTQDDSCNTGDSASQIQEKDNNSQDYPDDPVNGPHIFGHNDLLFLSNNVIRSYPDNSMVQSYKIKKQTGYGIRQAEGMHPGIPHR
jgi:hypothetical protein